MTAAELADHHITALEARVHELVETNNRLYDYVAQLEKELGKVAP